METVLKHFDVLGMEAEDKITGLKGVVTSLDFDLYGCIQVGLTPKEKDGKAPTSSWFDINRIKVTGKKRVMPLPFYGNAYIAGGNKGAASLPEK